MRVDRVTPILNVSDLLGSIGWFEALGWKRGFVWGEPEPDFASVVCGSPEGSGEIFLCHGDLGARPVWLSWFLPSLDALEAAHNRAVELGYEIALPPKDEPWGMREFHLRHPDGHTFRVSSVID